MNKPQTTIRQREAALKRELATRVLARRSLLQYTKRFHPSYDAGWVHEDMCRRLEQFSKDVAAKKSPRLMLLMPPRSGKQLAHDTPVLTTAGWVTHGQLRPGDEVFHPSGKPVSVVAVSDDTPSDVRVELTDGSVFYTHENHEWLVYERSGQRWRVVDTRYLMERTLWSSGRAVFQLPVTGALQYPEAVLPMDPYAFGAWLGDGSSTKPCITHAKSDMAVVDAIEALGYPRTTVCVHQTTGVLTTYFSGPRPNVRGRMTTELQSMGLMTRGTKHIPEVFLRSSVQQRLQLLAGLIDTDGHIDKCGRVIISSVLPELVKGIFELARCLGFRPYTHEVQPVTSTSGIVGRQVVYTVGFQPTMSIPCRLPRKQVKRFATQRRVGVRSVSLDPCGKTGRCIQVDSPDGLYVVGDKLVPTHNSELASIRFPAWHLGHHPEHEMINCGYNLDLPMKFSRKVREQLRDRAYEAMFAETKLDAESQSVEAWNTTAGGGFTAAGVGGGITGKGAHVLTIDDPLKNMEEADSAVVRENLWDWYWSTAYTRLAPGGGVLVIQTLWHDDDLAGRLHKQMMNMPDADQFVIIKYPALAEADEYLTPDGDIVRVDPDQLSFDPPPDGSILLRPKGESLHPERYPTKMMENYRANMHPRIWSALYQQNPVPDEGMYFKAEWFRTEPTAPMIRKRRIYQAWDFAIGEKQQNDFTVGATILHDENNFLHVLDIVRFKGDTFVIIEEILNALQKWTLYPDTPVTLGFEDGQIWRALKPVLEMRMHERNLFPPYEVLKPLTDKLVRARALQGRMQQGRVLFLEAEWLHSAKQEMMRFPAGAHDDIVDALAWACNLIVNKSPPTPDDRVPVTKSWKDKLNNLGTAGSSHMAA